MICIFCRIRKLPRTTKAVLIGWPVGQPNRSKPIYYKVGSIRFVVSTKLIQLLSVIHKIELHRSNCCNRINLLEFSPLLLALAVHKNKGCPIDQEAFASYAQKNHRE